nr:hypothetical protein Iba_chr10aCG13900 [Ipomoea batatas]
MCSLRNSGENGSDDALRLRRWLRVGGGWSSSLTAMASSEAEQPASTSSVLRGGIGQRRRLPPPLLSGELVVAGDSDGLFLLRRRRNDEFDGGLCQRAATAEHPSPLQRDGGGSSMVGTPRFRRAQRQDDACYFVDVFHEHVSSFYPNLVRKVKDDALLKVLDSNDDLESFTFDNDASINENDESLHDIVCGDDDIHIDENVCEMNDTEFMPPKSMPSKSRRKECAKKRKHDVGSSSRAAEGESDLLIPGGRSLRHLSGAQIARVEELRAKGASGDFYFDLPMLDAYGCREEVERMMTRRSWEHLFSWRDDTYEPVVHEFIATYTAIPSNHMWTPCMKFTLFGREHQVSLIQLGEYLGFYTPEDARTEEWRNLPTDFDSDAAAEAYWHQITNGQGGRFTGTKPNTSKVVRSPLLMMKLLLNLTFGRRNKNLHKIYRFDIFNLWSLEMNEPIQMACMVQQLFTSQTQPKCPYVWIGLVVTRLCHGLGLQTELAREKSIASMRPFTDAHLSMSYAPRIGAAPRPQQGEPPHEQEPVIQGGPDVPPEYAEMDLHHEELMRQNEAIVRQEECQEQQFQAIEQLRLWMEQRNLFSSPLSSMYGSPPPSPKGLPRAEMMVPRHTLERGEPNRRPNEDTSSEEWEASNMEVAHRGLMIEVEDLFSAKYIKVPELKIMWHIIARSWLGRQSPNDNVTIRELFILWSIYTGTPIHMGELCKAFLKRQSYEDSESIFVGPIVSRLCEALGFEDALAYEAVATTMAPLDIGDFLQFGIAPEEPSEDEARGERRDLWEIIEKLENWVNMLEHEVRRLTLERFGEESDGSGI